MSKLEQRVARAIGKEQRIFVDEGPLGYDLRLARAALKAIAEGGYAIFDKSCLGSPPAQQEDQPNE